MRWGARARSLLGSSAGAEPNDPAPEGPASSGHRRMRSRSARISTSPMPARIDSRVPAVEGAPLASLAANAGIDCCTAAMKRGGPLGRDVVVALKGRGIATISLRTLTKRFASRRVPATGAWAVYPGVEQ